MAKSSYRQSRSPVKAITSVSPTAPGNSLARQPFWGQSRPEEVLYGHADPRLTAADPTADSMACPECGVALRLQLQPVSANGIGASALRSAPAREPLPDFDQSVKDFQRELLSRALNENRGVMTRAAKALGLKYTTFVAMAHRLGVVDGNGTGGKQAAEPEE